MVEDGRVVAIGRLTAEPLSKLPTSGSGGIAVPPGLNVSTSREIFVGAGIYSALPLSNPLGRAVITADSGIAPAESAGNTAGGRVGFGVGAGVGLLLPWFP